MEKEEHSRDVHSSLAVGLTRRFTPKKSKSPNLEETWRNPALKNGSASIWQILKNRGKHRDGDYHADFCCFASTYLLFVHYKGRERLRYKFYPALVSPMKRLCKWWLWEGCSQITGNLWDIVKVWSPMYGLWRPRSYKRLLGWRSLYIYCI